MELASFLARALRPLTDPARHTPDKADAGLHEDRPRREPVHERQGKVLEGHGAAALNAPHHAFPPPHVRWRRGARVVFVGGHDEMARGEDVEES